ncbi:MAG: [acyl-carrier-protein] S-malonyltransferase [Acidobacteria bacterium]|nr:MAG: [acyl-carrier-protein] S-malonyltransferase [Acidobacteriota bacterium]
MSSPPIAFIFPGQGSQEVGMGRAWAEAHPAARAVFDQADEVLGFALSRLCWEGPEEELVLTANTQPALLATSVAIAQVLAGAGLAPAAVAGHSLGEYSALVATGALTFADALRLVRRRGELMQQAVPVGVGAMAAIMGIDGDAVTAVAAEISRQRRGEVCAVANLNGPLQTVIAGHRAAVEAAIELARSRGAKIAKLLPVSAPFHSPLMRPAREGLEPLLRATSFDDPSAPVVTNADARPATTGEEARDALIRQIDGPVRWYESMRYLRQQAGIGRFVEVGPKNVLCGLGRRIDRDASWHHLPGPEAIDKLLQER